LREIEDVLAKRQPTLVDELLTKVLKTGPGCRKPLVTGGVTKIVEKLTHRQPNFCARALESADFPLQIGPAKRIIFRLMQRATLGLAQGAEA